MHLMNWDTLCMPKKQGGANLKSAKDMNHALMAKPAWRLLTRTRNAWIDVLWAEYGIKAEDGAQLKGRQRSSNTWRGVIWGRSCSGEGCVGVWVMGGLLPSRRIDGWMRLHCARCCRAK